MGRIIFVYTLFESAEEARRISRQLVQERLAACANMLAPCTSIYEWEGRLSEEGEFPVLFKTALEKRDALVERIRTVHSYDVPAILSWEAEANGAYADWIGGQTSSS